MTESAPKMPGATRRFGGTHAQIRSALRFYRALAYATGFMLLLVVVEMVAKYGFGTEIIVGGFNFSRAVLIAHGWLYVVYLIADFRLWQLMRWPFRRFLFIALGGVVPLLSFTVERLEHRRAEQELAAHPEHEPAGPDVHGQGSADYS
jgi:integral membrane protein